MTAALFPALRSRPAVRASPGRARVRHRRRRDPVARVHRRADARASRVFLVDAGPLAARPSPAASRAASSVAAALAALVVAPAVRVGAGRAPAGGRHRRGDHASPRRRGPAADRQLVARASASGRVTLIVLARRVERRADHPPLRRRGGSAPTTTTACSPTGSGPTARSRSASACSPSSRRSRGC